ncbi:MAG TPA: hypothetical protein VFQ42_01195, partial [Mycobacterium sp.]|nr:hypothetical protein [Mycobacterium sp.]
MPKTTMPMSSVRTSNDAAVLRRGEHLAREVFSVTAAPVVRARVIPGKIIPIAAETAMSWTVGAMRKAAHSAPTPAPAAAP